MLKKYAKILKVLFSIILYIAFVSVMTNYDKDIRRLLHIPLTFETVDNSKSELLNTLVTKSKFSSRWQWDMINTYQFDQPGYDSAIKEKAVRDFIGYYDGHFVRFIHTIIKYTVLPNKVNTDPMGESYGIDILINQVAISIPQDSTFTPPRCYIGIKKTETNETNIVRCVLAREHGDIQERIDLDIYDNIGIEAVAQFVNNIVAVFENKEVHIQ